MDEYSQVNQKLWDSWTPEHEKSSFYNVAAFQAGKDRLRSIELDELGDVAGKSLLHLQCHFGLDTLAWARRGAVVTGVDFSSESIALARSLSEELNIPAQFVCSTVETLPDVLTGQFDIVYTSYGVLHWLQDLRRWGQVIAHFLKSGAIFYIVEDHPMMRVFDVVGEGVEPAAPYFFSEKPERVESQGSYAAPGEEQFSFYIWNHALSEIINSLLEARLRLAFLHEFPYAARAKWPGMVQGEDGWWRLKERHGTIPFLFSLQARK
jgi:SAM-dependent methyltransferase